MLNYVYIYLLIFIGTRGTRAPARGRIKIIDRIHYLYKFAIRSLFTLYKIVKRMGNHLCIRNLKDLQSQLEKRLGRKGKVLQIEATQKANSSHWYCTEIGKAEILTSSSDGLSTNLKPNGKSNPKLLVTTSKL